MEHARFVQHSRDLKVFISVAQTHVHRVNTFSKADTARLARATREQQQVEEPVNQSLAWTMRFVKATAPVSNVHHIPHYPQTGKNADQEVATRTHQYFKKTAPVWTALTT